MGRAAKVRGTSFEYRVRNWFNEREGWAAERNPLSGASEQFTEAVGKHDVRAWRKDQPIFLQIEAKKRGRVKDAKKRNQIEVMHEWIEKIDFNNDEILVIGFDRSDLYVVLTTDRFFKILGRSYNIEYDKSNTYSGSKQFVLKEEDLKDKDYFHLTAFDQNYTALLLDKFVTLRETAELDDEISIEERIKRCLSIEDLQTIEKEHLAELTYSQKKLLYQKFEQLESDSFVNPLVKAESQFWLDDAFLIICPHCEEKITRKDLKEKADD